MANNNCLWVEVIRFPDEGYAQSYIARKHEMEETHIYAGMCFKRTLVGDCVYEYHYGDVPHGRHLDEMWHNQVQSMDPFLTQGGSGRLGSNALGGGTVSTTGLIDYDEEEVW